MSARGGAVVLAAALGLGAAAGIPAVARADLGDWQVGIHLFGANLRRDAMQWGGGAGAHASLGLSTAWSIVAMASWRVVAPRNDSTGARVSGAHVFGGAVGVAFAIDVLRVVPSVAGGIGLWVVAADGGLRAAPGAELGLRLDYALDRNWSLGIDVVRARVLWLAGALAPGFEFGGRVTYAFF